MGIDIDLARIVILALGASSVAIYLIFALFASFLWVSSITNYLESRNPVGN